GGLGMVAARNGNPITDDAPTQVRQPLDPDARAGERKPIVDAFGDPLPPGAIARMGTTRFRHAEGVTCAVFAPDGKTVITASLDSTLRAWDTATGKELRRFVGHRGPVRQIALSPNGALLASWGEIAEEQDHIRIWDVAKSKELLQ